MVLYGLIIVIALWLVGPFVWLFVTSVSYQKNLLARPFALIPPEITLDNYRMILGLVRFHAEGQAAKILPSMLNTLIVASVVTIVNLVVGTIDRAASDLKELPSQHALVDRRQRLAFAQLQPQVRLELLVSFPLLR